MRREGGGANHIAAVSKYKSGQSPSQISVVNNVKIGIANTVFSRFNAGYRINARSLRWS